MKMIFSILIIVGRTKLSWKITLAIQIFIFFFQIVEKFVDHFCNLFPISSISVFQFLWKHMKKTAVIPFTNFFLIFSFFWIFSWCRQWLFEETQSKNIFCIKTKKIEKKLSCWPAMKFFWNFPFNCFYQHYSATLFKSICHSEVIIIHFASWFFLQNKD